jgi:hypothetical protein
MAAKVRGTVRHHNHMSGSRCDLLLAARAQVGLDGLIRLDATDLRRTLQRGINAHNSIPATTATANATIT